MELVILAALGYVVWRFVLRKGPGGRSQPPPPKGRPAQPPPPKGRPAGTAFVYATFSAEGRDAWPANVLKAVEGIHEIASADDPTTLAKMRAVAKRLTRLAQPVVDYLEPLHKALEDSETPEAETLGDLLDEAYYLLETESEAADAEDEVSMDVIGHAQGFVDAWQKARHP